MAFLQASGNTPYFFIDRYVGHDRHLKEWVYITTDSLSSIVAAGYFSGMTGPLPVPGDVIRVYRAVSRSDLSTASAICALLVRSWTSSLYTVLWNASAAPGSPPVNFAYFGGVGDDSTYNDDAFDRMHTYLGDEITAGRSPYVTFGPGIYRVQRSINLTSLRYGSAGGRTYLDGQGATIKSYAGNVHTFDALDSNYLTFANFNVVGNSTSPQKTGFCIGRAISIASTNTRTASNVEVRGCNTLGSFNWAGFYNNGSELNDVVDCAFRNDATTGLPDEASITTGSQSIGVPYAAILDSGNNWGVTSDYLTVTQPVGGTDSFNNQMWHNVSLWRLYGGAGLFLPTKVARLRMDGCYSAIKNGDSVIVYVTRGHVNKASPALFTKVAEWDIDLHMEGDTADTPDINFNNAFRIIPGDNNSGSAIGLTFRRFFYHDKNNMADKSIFCKSAIFPAGSTVTFLQRGAIDIQAFHGDSDAADESLGPPSNGVFYPAADFKVGIDVSLPPMTGLASTVRDWTHTGDMIPLAMEGAATQYPLGSFLIKAGARDYRNYKGEHRFGGDKAATYTGSNLPWTHYVSLGKGQIGFSGGPIIEHGTGSPEGSVTANANSLYVQTDASGGSTLWVKVSGTGNTGWALVSWDAYARPETYGAYGDATVATVVAATAHDDTAAIQAAINTGKPVLLTGRYWITSRLTGTMNLRGVGVYNRDDLTKGSYLFVTDTVNEALLVNQGSNIQGVNFHYPNQVVTGTPTVYPATVKFKTPSAGAMDIVVSDNVFVNSYIAIDTAGNLGTAKAGLGTIERNLICAISIGINHSYTLTETFIRRNWISYVHWAASVGQAIRTTISSTAIAIRLLDVVGTDVSDNLIYGVGTAISFANAPGITNVTGNTIDGCRNGIAFDGCTGLMGPINIVGNSIGCIDPNAGAFTTTRAIGGTWSSGSALTGFFNISGNQFTAANGDQINFDTSVAASKLRLVVDANNFLSAGRNDTTNPHYCCRLSDTGSRNSTLVFSGNTYDDSVNTTTGKTIGVKFDGKTASIVGNQFYYADKCVDVSTLDATHYATISGNAAGAVNTAALVLPSVTAAVSVQGNRWADSTFTVASAATITLPDSNVDVVTLSGTTTIGTITASWPGRVVTLLTTSGLTFTKGTSLVLHTTFIAAANDTLTLMCDGTNWYELSRGRADRITRTGTSWATNSDPLFMSQGSINGVLTQTGIAAAHVFNINSDNADCSSANGNYNGYFGHTVGGSGAKGEKTALAAVMVVNAATGNATNHFYTGLSGVAQGLANDGGTPGTTNGTMVGIFGSASLNGTATYYQGLIGMEIDVEARAGNAPTYKTGLQIVQRVTDVESGTGADEAIVLSNQSASGTPPRWSIGFSFGTPHGIWPIKDTGTMIGTQSTALGGPAYAAAYGIDFSAVTFGTSAFKSAGFSVDPTGVVECTGINSDSGTGTATGTGATSTLTLSKMAGVVTTDAITTAAGASHVMTVTNTKVAAGDMVFLQLQSDGTNTRTDINLQCAVTGASTFTVTIFNRELANAVNGTIKFAFLVVKA